MTNQMEMRLPGGAVVTGTPEQLARFVQVTSAIEPTPSTPWKEPKPDLDDTINGPAPIKSKQPPTAKPHHPTVRPGKSPRKLLGHAKPRKRMTKARAKAVIKAYLKSGLGTWQYARKCGYTHPSDMKTIAQQIRYWRQKLNM